MQSKSLAAAMLGRFLEMVILVAVVGAFAVLNITVRMSVDGKTWSWFSITVPRPERFPTGMVKNPDAQMMRGWPWGFQHEVGWVFTTKDGQKLFLPKPTALPMWQRISAVAFLADIGVFCVALVMLWLALNLRVWRPIMHGGMDKSPPGSTGPGPVV